MGAALLFGTLVVAAQSAAPSVSAAPRIWDVRAGRFVSERELVADLATARFRLLGEMHDNPAHHDIRARLIMAIAATGVAPAVVFEQFDIDNDDALVAAQTDDADAERIADAGKLDRKSWEWPLHKPLIAAALASRLPIRAGNLPRSALRGDLVTAAKTDTGAIWFARLNGARWGDAQAAEMRADIVESHCRKLPESAVPRLVLAQRMRDATMAQALVNAATAGGAILIAGNGHVRTDLGVTPYLAAPALPDSRSRVVSVGLIEVAAQDDRAAEFPRAIVAEHPGFDYLWFTPRVSRDDPCQRI